MKALFFKFIVSTLFGIVLLGCAQAESASPRLAADIAFHCLWWSEAQMERFDPNAPPPKTTEIEIQKWEYTDPVGVPHPDVVDAVIQLKNEGTSAVSGIVAEVVGQWRIGPLKSRKNASWSKFESLKTQPVETIGPGDSVTFRVPIDIAAKIAESEKRDFWPWMFRAVLKVQALNFDKPLLTHEADLPIHPGD